MNHMQSLKFENKVRFSQTYVNGYKPFPYSWMAKSQLSHFLIRKGLNGFIPYKEKTRKILKCS